MADSDSDVVTISDDEDTVSYPCQRCPGRDFHSAAERDRHVKAAHDPTKQVHRSSQNMARRGGAGRKPYIRPMSKNSGTPEGSSSPSTNTESSSNQSRNGRPQLALPTATRGRALKITSTKSSDSSPKESKTDK